MAAHGIVHRLRLAEGLYRRGHFEHARLHLAEVLPKVELAFGKSSIFSAAARDLSANCKRRIGKITQAAAEQRLVYTTTAELYGSQDERSLAAYRILLADEQRSATRSVAAVV